MHFCVKCDNMYYIRLGGDDDNKNKLIYTCRHCGDENSSLSVQESICVSKTEIKKTSDSYKNFINEYTKLDPTLPRINNISCPNNECSSNSNGENKAKNEIIYLRYNDKDMKYIYMCANCDYVWKTDNK